MADYETTLQDVFDQLGSIYNLLERIEDRTAERHRELMLSLASIESNTAYIGTDSAVDELREANKLLKRIARDIG